MNRIEDFYAPRGKGAGDATGKPTGSNPNSHSIKYVCPCCHNSVRGTKVVRIKCADCDMDDDRTIKRTGSESSRLLLQNSGCKRPYSILMSTIQNESTYSWWVTSCYLTGSFYVSTSECFYKKRTVQVVKTTAPVPRF